MLGLVALLVLSAYIVAVQTIEGSLKVKVPLVVSLFIAVTTLLVASAALFNLGWGYWASAGACGFLALAHMAAPKFSYKKRGAYSEKLAAANVRIRADFRRTAARHGI
ncbi:MAG: hypothetical protein WA446_02070 [Steroidobacteraceae bacterium]